VRPRGLLIGALIVVGACTEDVTAPGQCPDYCPGGQITVIDTVLRTVIERDSTFRGYIRADEAAAMLLADMPFVDSRAIWRTVLQQPRILVRNDTLTGAILGVDSAWLRIVITHRDTAAHNLALSLYRLPLTIDTATTFADLAGPFTDSLIKAVNVDSLLAQPGHRDPVTGDSVIFDSTSTRIILLLKLDSAQARYVPADTGRLAFGLRVSADSLASIAIGSNATFGGGLDPQVTRYVTVDSATVAVKRTLTPRGAEFDSYVFTPSAPALDSTLAVGGVPSARSLLRFTLPRAIRDSAQIVRATLMLVPGSPAQGVPADSFFVVANGVTADLGAKSPIAAGDSSRTGSTRVRIGQTDTVRIDLTRLLRIWSSDTTAANAVMLRVNNEGSTFAEIRFQPSTNAAFRPALHITYVPRFPFGVP
jgi:hypothetical protein